MTEAAARSFAPALLHPTKFSVPSKKGHVSGIQHLVSFFQEICRIILQSMFEC